MHREIYDMLRGGLLLLLILIAVILCATDETDKIPEFTEPAVTTTTEAPEPAETEAPTETTEPETEPAVAAVPPTEPEPDETWESLGTYTLTAYCPCEQCCGIYGANRPTDENGDPIVYTSIGAVARAGTTIAVDPSIIPYGSEVKINGHVYIAQDTGGAMRGNRVDIYFTDHQEALNFGRQTAEVFLKTTPR